MSSSEGAATGVSGVPRMAAGPAEPQGSHDEDLAGRYARVRGQSEALCEPLAIEDYGVQPMDDASPPKWHLAHTTWFFETFLLKEFATGYQAFDGRYEMLFNSYYNGVGNPYPRPRRGFLSRPTVGEVYDYRAHVDDAMAGLVTGEDGEVRQRIELGLNHEQQHQELILTDLKYNLGLNPLKPAYREDLDREASGSLPLKFDDYPGGILSVGAGGPFCFDNELPRHRVLLEPFALAGRLVTNAEFLEFMEDGGYESPALWLSDGWAAVRANGWKSPLYWRRQETRRQETRRQETRRQETRRQETRNQDGRSQDGGWLEYRLGGERALVPDDPLVHVSAYEADAFARWAGCRLPTEFEWESAAAPQDSRAGNFADDGRLHPASVEWRGREGVQRRETGAGNQFYGDAWEWTSSAYGPYPGYRTPPGALGEYNGKFMSNQLVLRGGSCATPRGHVRASYRNFFYPPHRWQFSGIRLARDLG